MDIIARHEVKAVYWNRCYEPWRIHRDVDIKNHLKKADIKVQSFNGSLLWEPWTIKKIDNSPYKVFTPFYRKGCLRAAPPHEPLPAPTSLKCHNDCETSITINQLELLPRKGWEKI
tara:strand:+ start:1681 stop:2028 length:348 start_codon:yes stop_codon:yes gene_type:complete